MLIERLPFNRRAAKLRGPDHNLHKPTYSTNRPATPISPPPSRFSTTGVRPHRVVTQMLPLLARLGNDRAMPAHGIDDGGLLAVVMKWQMQSVLPQSTLNVGARYQRMGLLACVGGRPCGRGGGRRTGGADPVGSVDDGALADFGRWRVGGKLWLSGRIGTL